MTKTYFILILSWVASAQAVEIRTNLTSPTENADGAYVASSILQRNGSADVVNYELVPASEAVSKTLASCAEGSLKANGSVLSRVDEIDPENHANGPENVKFFVRSATCVAR